MLRRLATSGSLLLLCVLVNAHLWAHESAAIPVVQIEHDDHGSDHDHPTTVRVRCDSQPLVVIVPQSEIAERPQLRRCHALRDQVAFGALRIDDDVGLYSLLLTYLI